MRFKKRIQRLFIFLFVFAFVFCDLANTGIFNTVQVQADTIKDYTEKGNKLHSNEDMGPVEIELLGHKSTTPFRKFIMDDKDDGNRRVICGYSLGRGHPGDTYTKKVVLATSWTDVADSKAYFMHNVQKIAKGLCWFYEDIGPKNASTLESYFIQTYVWAESMGKDTEKALQQMASHKGWNYTKKVKPLYDTVKKRKVEGYVVIYRKTDCKEGNKCIHQPYFRWIKTPVESDSVTASASGDVEKKVSVEVYKQDAATTKPVQGAKFKATTKDVDGKTLTVGTDKLTTDKNGKASASITRKFTAKKSSTKNYVKNWDKLTKKQKAAWKEKGYYPNKSLAQAAAKKEAKKKAEEAAAKAKANFSANWKIEEASVPGYIYKNKDGSNKSVTRQETGNTLIVTYKFNNTPKYGKIKLYKACEDSYSTEYDLSGAVYEVHKGSETGTVVSSITISKNKEDGKDVYSGVSGSLTAGDYYVKETQAPAGFEKDSKVYHFRLEDAGGTTKTLTAKNTNGNTITSLTSTETAKKGTVRLTKYLKDLVDNTGTVPEEGVEFTLKASSKLKGDSPYTDGVSMTTDKNGNVSWSDVPYGYYTLEMTGKDLPKNITTVGPFSLHVEDDTEANKNDQYSGKNIVLGKTPDTGETVDEKLSCSVAVHKMTSKTEVNGTKVFHPEAEAEFCIYDTAGKQVVAPFTTDKNGYGKSGGIEKAGTYVLKQLKGTASYKFMPDKEFEVKDKDLGKDGSEIKLFDYTVENSYQGDRIFLDKYKVAFNKETGKYEQKNKQAEPKAAFTVLNVSGIHSDDVKDLKKNGEGWTEEERAAFLKKYKNAILAEMETDENGRACADIDCIEDGEGRMHSAIGKDGFVILQTKGTEGYYLNKPLFSAEMDTKENDGSVQWTGSQDNLEITKYALARFVKKKTTGEGTTEPEAGAEFKVRKNDDTYLEDPDGNTIVCTADKNGVVYIPWLLNGVYTLEQTKGSSLHEKLSESTDANAVFAVNENALVFEKKEMSAFLETKNEGSLTETQKKQVVVVGDDKGQFTDAELPVKVTLQKTSTFTGVLLKDTEFTLYKKETGNWKEVGKYYTGDGEEGTELGKVTIHGLSFGTYKVKETKAPAGYLPSEYDQKVGSDDPDFQWQEKEFVIDASHVVKEDDGELAYRENIDMADSAVLKFRDTPIFGKIRINKTGNVLIDYTKSTDDFAYKTSGIGGATYALYAAEDIYDDAGNLIWKKDTKICQADTDEDGYASFKNNTVDYTDDFFMGRYYIKETKAPEGFDLDTQTHEVTLTWDAGAKKLDIEDWQPDITEYKEQESHGDYFLCTGEQLNPYIINAKKVIFTYEKAPKNAKAVYDVSSDRVGTKDNPTTADANSTVVLWEDPVESGTFYISTQTTANEVIFNKISSDMFYKCQALKSVIFFHVDTSYMVYADRMFAYDTSLKKLDLSNWVTGSLNSTVEMFANSGVLEKVYIGDTEQKVTGDEEPVATGIHTTPRQAKYLYTDPAQEEEDTLQTRKFTADSFNYALCYSDGEAESITITDEDIASIHPEYPDQMGKLTVTIRLKPDSRYYAQAKDGGEENGVLKVTVDVVDPASLKLDPVVDEHPEASVDVEDTQKSVALSILKIDADKKGTADEERAGLEATFEVYAATDLKNYNGDTIIKEGERIQTIKSIDKDTDDGGRAGTDSLPTGYYAVDPNASYLYKVVETVPPKGYALYPDEKKNTAYIPNLDYLNANSETILSAIKKANADTISATYSLSENTYTFALTFTDIKAPTITKDWGERRTKGYVEEKDRPESLTIHMYTDKGKTDLYKTITLTKEKKWIYAFDHDIDLTKYYYEEEVPDDAEWKKDTREYEDGYFKDGETNCVTFYNWYDKDTPEVIPSVTKYWEDNENAPQKRPNKIIVNLLQNGVVLDKVSNIELSESNNWTFTVAEKDALPKYDDVGQEYVYTWEEDLSTLPKEYEQTNTKTTTSSDEQYTYIHTDITNTYAQYTSAEISKLWDDESDLYKLRPASVTVHLLANGKQVNKLTLESNETGKTKTTDITDGNIVLSKDNKWSAKAVNLPKYDGKKKIEYTWKEEVVPDYELTSNLTVTKDAETVTEKTETTMTNKLIPSSGSVAVSKLIPVSSLDIRHGDIDFTFTIKGKTIHNKEYTDKKTVTFTKDTAATQDNVVTIDGKAYVKLSVSFAGLDWGEYKITESGSESRYQFNKISGLANATTGKEKDGTPYVAFTVDKTHQEFSGTFENVTIPGSIKIVKHGKSKKDKLKGVTFKIEKILAGNKTKLVDTKETDEDGQILFEALEPGDYLITETKTLPGYTLLKAPFKATIPMAMTAKEAAEQKADTTKATYDKANALYYFYDLTYDVDNEAIPSVPMTGAFDNWKTFVPIILAMALFIGVGIYQMKKRKKPVK